MTRAPRIVVRHHEVRRAMQPTPDALSGQSCDPTSASNRLTPYQVGRMARRQAPTGLGVGLLGPPVLGIARYRPNLDLAGAIVFPGLTLPDLAAHLRGVHDPGTHHWPHDARLLRALVAPGEEDVGPALERYARLPGYDPSPAGIDRATRSTGRCCSCCSRSGPPSR